MNEETQTPQEQTPPQPEVLTANCDICGTQVQGATQRQLGKALYNHKYNVHNPNAKKHKNRNAKTAKRGVGKFRCDVCGIAWPTQQGLNVHQRRAHGPHKDAWSKSTALANKARAKQPTEHRVYSYKCGSCNKVMNNKTNMRGHIMRHHPEVQDVEGTIISLGRAVNKLRTRSESAKLGAAVRWGKQFTPQAAAEHIAQAVAPEREVQVKPEQLLNFCPCCGASLKVFQMAMKLSAKLE